MYAIRSYYASFGLTCPIWSVESHSCFPVGENLARQGRFYRRMTTRDRTRSEKAGKDFFMGSRTFRCIDTAPSIRSAMPIAAGFVTDGIRNNFV